MEIMVKSQLANTGRWIFQKQVQNCPNPELTKLKIDQIQNWPNQNPTCTIYIQKQYIQYITTSADIYKMVAHSTSSKVICCGASSGTPACATRRSSSCPWWCAGRLLCTGGHCSRSTLGCSCPLRRRLGIASCYPANKQEHARQGQTRQRV